MIELNVLFKGGKQSGKTAIAKFTKFHVGLEFPVEGEIYTMAAGAIANVVENTQTPIINTCLVAVLKHAPEYN